VGGPFNRLGVDVLQLPKSSRGNRYAVVFMDYLTKWPEVFPAVDQTAPTIAKLLVEGVISQRVYHDKNALTGHCWTCCQRLWSHVDKTGTPVRHMPFLHIELLFNYQLENLLSSCYMEGILSYPLKLHCAHQQKRAQYVRRL